MTEAYVSPDLRAQDIRITHLKDALVQLTKEMEEMHVKHQTRLNNQNAAIEALLSEGEKAKAHIVLLENAVQGLTNQLSEHLTPKKRKAVWTPEEDEIVRKTAGLPMRERRLQLPTRTKAAITLRTYALGLSNSLGPREWSKQEEERLLKMRNQGFSWTRITDELKRSVKACQQHLVIMRRETARKEMNCEQKDGDRHSPGDTRTEHGTNGQAS